MNQVKGKSVSRKAAERAKKIVSPVLSTSFLASLRLCAKIVSGFGPTQKLDSELKVLVRKVL
jgi:hypothetical protein